MVILEDPFFYRRTDSWIKATTGAVKSIVIRKKGYLIFLSNFLLPFSANTKKKKKKNWHLCLGPECKNQEIKWQLLQLWTSISSLQTKETYLNACCYIHLPILPSHSITRFRILYKKNRAMFLSKAGIWRKVVRTACYDTLIQWFHLMDSGSFWNAPCTLNYCT